MTKMDLFDLYQKLISLVNSAQGGFIRPQVNFENWLATINTEFFRDCFSEYEKSQQLSDEYKLPFLKSVNAIVGPLAGSPFGFIPYPADYQYFSSARMFMRKDVACAIKSCGVMKDVDKNGRGIVWQWEDPEVQKLKALLEKNDATEIPVGLVDNQYFGSLLEHETKAPTLQSPAITQVDGGFKIAPAGIGVVVLDYLRTPVRPVFVYAPGTGDTVIYNQGASTQLEWSSIVENEFLSRLAMKTGLYTRDEIVSKLSAQEYQIAHK